MIGVAVRPSVLVFSWPRPPADRSYDTYLLVYHTRFFQAHRPAPLRLEAIA